jgi:hypothetical protein
LTVGFGIDPQIHDETLVKLQNVMNRMTERP